MDKVSKYIVENWDKTVRAKETLSGDIKINRPYMSPCISGMFEDLYYWDVYFINEGLLLDGRYDLAENNVDNIGVFIDKLGYMPNANYLRDRTQPPVFTRCVYKLYQYKQDINTIKKYLPLCVKEYNFFQKNRMTEIGLNAFGTHGTTKEILDNYSWHHGRVQEESDKLDEQLKIGKDIMAIAESGLDFNMRFRTKESKIDAYKFAHLDLNCILYDVERKIAKMYEILGDNAESKNYNQYAEKRRTLIDKYFWDEEKQMYLDYNFVEKTHSQIISSVSLYPFTFEVSNNKKSAQEVYKRLMLEKGITVTEYRGEDIYFQWDYPCMWPAATYFDFVAFKNLGLEEEAKTIAKRYVDCVYAQFEKTGKIWEKYDARDGSVAVTSEYETPEMLGWTASIYRVFAEELKAKGEEL